MQVVHRQRKIPSSAVQRPPWQQESGHFLIPQNLHWLDLVMFIAGKLPELTAARADGFKLMFIKLVYQLCVDEGNGRRERGELKFRVLAHYRSGEGPTLQMDKQTIKKSDFSEKFMDGRSCLYKSPDFCMCPVLSSTWILRSCRSSYWWSQPRHKQQYT